MERLLAVMKEFKPEVDFLAEKELIEDGVLDSLDVVEIIEIIEKEFGIEITPDEIDSDNFESIDAMWNLVQRHIK